MDPVVKGIFFTIAIILAVISAARVSFRNWHLFPIAFAVFVVPFAWDAFDLAGDS